jgi:two-component SAPR family response regulator
MLIAFIIDDDLDNQKFFLLVIHQISDSVKYIFGNDDMRTLSKLKTNTSFTPGLNFIDINMPKVNGMQFLAESKKIISCLKPENTCKH